MTTFIGPDDPQATNKVHDCQLSTYYMYVCMCVTCSNLPSARQSPPGTPPLLSNADWGDE